MIRLNLLPEELPGAIAIADWLDSLIQEEGTDRPTFAAVAHYIVSDIRDNVDGVTA